MNVETERINPMTQREIDDKLMEILKEKGIGLSRAAIFIMLEDGICTQEAPIDWYVTALNEYRKLVE